MGDPRGFYYPNYPPPYPYYPGYAPLPGGGKDLPEDPAKKSEMPSYPPYPMYPPPEFWKDAARGRPPWPYPGTFDYYGHPEDCAKKSGGAEAAGEDKEKNREHSAERKSSDPDNNKAPRKHSGSKKGTFNAGRVYR